MASKGAVCEQHALQTRHELKTWPKPFAAIISGRKKDELRVNDRCFQMGDDLWLREWNPDTQQYTGRYVVVNVTHITEGGTFGLPPELCVMSISILYFNFGDNNHTE